MENMITCFTGRVVQSEHAATCEAHQKKLEGERQMSTFEDMKCNVDDPMDWGLFDPAGWGFQYWPEESEPVETLAMDLVGPPLIESQNMSEAQRIRRDRIHAILDDQDSDEKGPPWLWKKKKSDVLSDYVIAPV